MDKELRDILIEIRDNQHLALQRQEEQLTIARTQMDRAQAQTSEALAMQKAAMARFARLSKIIFPLIAFCIAAIIFLIVRFFV